MDNKIVVHFRDGRLLKGTTSNFSPVREKFHVAMLDGRSVEVFLDKVKAVFFVRRLEGNRSYNETKSFAGAHGFGKKVRCEFPDGEVLTGFAPAYDAARLGAFITPSDPKSNNERIFVVNGAIKRVSIEA